MQPQIQPAGQPQQGKPSAPPQMAPQGNPPAAPTVAPQHSPSGRENQPYNSQLLGHLENHLSKLPDDQKAYLVQYMTPELAILLGIVIGNEGYDYFSKFADPQKMLVVQPRPEQQPQQTAPQQAQPPAQSGGMGQPQPQPQPKASTPATSIMGV